MLTKIDCDLHVVEPHDLWSSIGLDGTGWVGLKWRHLADPFASYEEYNRPPDEFQYTKGIASHYADGFTSKWDNHSTVRAMDRIHVNKALLIPTRGLLAITMAHEYGIQNRICEIYNNWITEYCSAYPDRLMYAALGIWHTYDLPKGASAIVTRPNKIEENYGAPIFSCAEEYNVPLVLHEGTSPSCPGIGFNNSRNRLQAHAMTHPFEAMNAVLHLTMGGILHNHPTLRVLICEAGDWWFDGWIQHLNSESSGVNGYGLYDLPARPVVYSDRIWLSASDPMSPNSVFGSDYPHGDSEYPWVNPELAADMIDNAEILLYGNDS